MYGTPYRNQSIQFGTEKYYFRTKGKIPGENPNFSGQSKQFQVLQDMYEQ